MYLALRLIRFNVGETSSDKLMIINFDKYYYYDKKTILIMHPLASNISLSFVDDVECLVFI